MEGVRTETALLKKRIQELELEKSQLTGQVNLGTVAEEALVEEANKLIPSPSPTAPPRPVGGTAPVKAEEDAKKKKEQAVSGPGPNAAVDQRPNQVLSVNRKFNFVVVNMGLRNQIKIGDVLRVEQNGQLIGRVQVEKLYENFSACGITEEIKPAQIQEGDLVRIA